MWDLKLLLIIATPTSYDDDQIDGAMSPAMKKLFYEELVFSWIKAYPATRAIVYSNAWFFFEILVSDTVTYIDT